MTEGNPVARLRTQSSKREIPSSLERFFVWTIFKAELWRMTEGYPVARLRTQSSKREIPSSLARFFVWAIIQVEHWDGEVLLLYFIL
ncbi:hypothetical protein B7P33_18120 [Sediminicola luteus]|uniref:Uncharacterized protein n=1 Tax=Sediminicola luteus TaxID=319238 RepID=A0A2A4G296_9FLAO|nr:hypothetical protein B7P33_18120 [Sediminicola luteus]